MMDSPTQNPVQALSGTATFDPVRPYRSLAKSHAIIGHGASSGTPRWPPCFPLPYLSVHLLGLIFSLLSSIRIVRLRSWLYKLSHLISHLYNLYIHHQVLL